MIEDSFAAKEPSHPILYSCSCNGSIRPGSDVLTGPTTALFPLSQLYFCDSNTDIRCPFCTSEEFSGCFCPNCLFDSVTIAVKTEKARCNRQCFDCPVCFSALAIVPVPLADSTVTAVVLSSDSDHQNGFGSPDVIHSFVPVLPLGFFFSGVRLGARQTYRSGVWHKCNCFSTPHERGVRSATILLRESFCNEYADGNAVRAIEFPHGILDGRQWPAGD
ncbi:hypothetical protein M427DRAFT_333725 [Gonapodya prolifera JEL478]|uniref:Dynactin subunit 4 n=1 Tax=Gonapodya prolifera (strain JEL478) TaxID=1344416 RepID=A0A139ADY0_GONPJ|nr:hypothetical protein M427DRAFT_333725 [Gonapodya prolifera JEL478]|eukprot:KXS15022.1 hypothetical protein M427DRAFT_333725 [Gonapodya prolifera JEL478]